MHEGRVAAAIAACRPALAGRAGAVYKQRPSLECGCQPAALHLEYGSAWPWQAASPSSARSPICAPRCAAWREARRDAWRWSRPWAPCTRAISSWCVWPRPRCTRAVVSIFVNPAQFAPHEDFDRYPRDEAGDLAKLASVGCDAVWAPTLSEMYAEGFATRIVPAGAAEGLESDFRPHFFGGVATVCCKLFTQVLPDVAVFGEKDYQQLMVVTQMVRDLDLPLEIVGAPTVREADGLAMSSRNAYLSADERRIAPTLNRAHRGGGGQGRRRRRCR